MTETLRERLERARADLRYDVEDSLLLDAWDNGDLVPRDEHESALSAAREEAARAERERAAKVAEQLFVKEPGRCRRAHGPEIAAAIRKGDDHG